MQNIKGHNCRPSKDKVLVLEEETLKLHLKSGNKRVNHKSVAVDFYFYFILLYFLYDVEKPRAKSLAFSYVKKIMIQTEILTQKVDLRRFFFTLKKISSYR